MSKPYIDLILLCYGKFAAMTKPCLDSILLDYNNDNFRLTVIDNASYDDSANELKEYLKPYPLVRTQFLEKNIGFAGGMNLGASLSNSEWLLLVSNDTIFAPGSLVSLYEALLAQPSDVGMVGPVTNAAGNGQGYNFTGNANQIIADAKLFQQYPCHVQIPTYRLDFFCAAIRRSLWTQLQGLDSIYGAGYYEDTDFSIRAKAVGVRMLICEDAFVYHVGGATLSTSPQTRQLIKRNKKIFKRRHPHAILYHKRQDNLAVLEEYLKLYQQGIWNEGLTIRTGLRIKALKTNLPRSLIKKWLWQLKVNKMLQSLAVISTAP
jgi:GT2 family glycosyltransferase